MSDSPPRLATIGEVAKLLRVPLHRIEYVLRTRSHIRPRATAGGARCFDNDAIARIRLELNAIGAKPRSRRAGGDHE